MDAAIKTAKAEQKESGPHQACVKRQGIVADLVGSIDPKPWKFSGKYVGTSKTFYAVKAMTRAWFEDRKWLEQNWRKIVSDVELFAVETGTSGLSAGDVRGRHWTTANEVILKFSSSQLSSEFLTPSGWDFVSFENVVGGLCKRWLYDSPIYFCLAAIARMTAKCYVLSSLASTVGCPMPPTAPITAAEFIVYPVYLTESHWGS
ncbi:hypothetical protein PC113_g3262 [Phytophthora cactorum]|nr:hypothetical protein PC113_g3262 [Phytophthora cactorum]